jgi:NAD(P)-dependent dehydrogenase (short-subunit alcohol dehydrogenase family)
MYNPFSLAGKTVLVTGASSGIGRAIAIECSRMGARVYLTARNIERLNETRSMMEGKGHVVIQADLSDREQGLPIVDAIEGELNGVVHCAGCTVSKPFQFLKEEDVDGVMTVNFKAPVFLTQSLLKEKKLAKGCSVVFISSVSGVYVSAVAESIYSASKAALNGMIKGMAIELGARGIRVNSVNPGLVDTNFFSDGTISEEQLEESVRKYPLKRHGNPQEIAYGVVYLLSDASSWVTGSNLVIDGGYILQ